MLEQPGSAQADPVVDVGIAAWGHSQFLEETIECVENQTLSAWRLHISQDGGAEPSVEDLVTRRAGDARFVYSSTGRAIGAAGNKTRLIRSAGAPYVALLDHDDLWDADFLRRRVEFLELHPSCGFVCSPTRIIDGNGTTVGHTGRLLPEGIYASDEAVPWLLRWSGIPGGTVVARRSAYRDAGDEFNDALPRTYDYEMWVRLALRFPIGCLDVYDASWRRHERNASATQLFGYGEEYDLLVSRLSDLVRAERPDLLPSDEVWRRKVSSLLLMTALDALESRERKAAWHFLLRALRRSGRSAFDARAYAVALGVAFGPPAAAVVARSRSRKRRIRSTNTA